MADSEYSLSIYYDGGCPLCRREIGYYRRRPGADRLNWVNLLVATPDELGPDLDPADAMARLHVRGADGRLVSGARAFALLWQHLPGFQTAGRIAAMPGIVHALEIGYRLVLRVRHLWRKPSPACELPRKDRA